MTIEQEIAENTARFDATSCQACKDAHADASTRQACADCSAKWASYRASRTDAADRPTRVSRTDVMTTDERERLIKTAYDASCAAHGIGAGQRLLVELEGKSDAYLRGRIESLLEVRTVMPPARIDATPSERDVREARHNLQAYANVEHFEKLVAREARRLARSRS